jgi:hypothetical protein
MKTIPWILCLGLFVFAVRTEMTNRVLAAGSTPAQTREAVLNEFQNPCPTPSWGHSTAPDLVKGQYLVWRCESGKSYVIRLEAESVR